MNSEEIIRREIEKSYEENLKSVPEIYIFDKIPAKKLRNARETHKLDLHDEVYLLYDLTVFGSAKNSTLFLPNGISIYNSDLEQEHILLSWSSIENVAVIDEDKFVFYFDKEDKNNHRYIKSTHFVFGMSNKYYEAFADLIRNIAKHFEDEDAKKNKELWDNYWNCVESENWQGALDFSNRLIEMDNQVYVYHRMKAECLYHIEKYEQALDCINTSIQLMDRQFDFENRFDEIDEDDKDYYAWTLILHGDILLGLDRYYNSLWVWRESLCYLKDQSEINRIGSLIKENEYDFVKNGLINFPYGKRKLLYVDKLLPNQQPEKFLALSTESVSDIKFPPGHPVNGELYVGHPYKENIYFPLSVYENELFQDKVMELLYLLQHLGATTVDIQYIQGTSIQAMDNLSGDTNLSLGVKIYEGGIQKGSSQKSSESNQSSRAISARQTFRPFGKPHVPEGLIWYDHDMTWQRLAQQRLSGGILETSINISSRSVEVVSQNELRNVAVEHENLFAKAKINRKLDISIEKQEEKTTEWNLKVEFAPIEEIEGITPSNPQAELKERDLLAASNKDEEDYLEFLEDCMEDGVVSNDEKKLLERRRQKLGISEERAMELQELSEKAKSFTPEEMEYIDELKFCLEDGQISDDERRLLDRFRKKLNISEDRVEEIERKFN